MEAATTNVAAALSELQLDDIPSSEFDAWMAAESADGLVLESGSMSTSEEGHEDDGDRAMLAARGAFVRWLAAYSHAAGQAAAASSASAGEVASPASDAQNVLWEAIASACPLAHKALLMFVQRRVLQHIAAPVGAAITEAARSAVLAARLYLTLLRLPGARAYGVFDAGLLRRCLGVLRGLVELCALADEEEGQTLRRKTAGTGRAAARGCGAGRAPPRRQASGPSAAAAAAAEGSRRNPRRAASGAGGNASAAMDVEEGDVEAEEVVEVGKGKGGKGAAAGDGDGDDAYSEASAGEESGEESEEGAADGAGRKRKHKAGAADANARRKRAAPSRSAGSAVAGAAATAGLLSCGVHLSRRDAALLLAGSIADLANLLADASLRLHGEVLPLLADTLLAAITLPDSIATGGPAPAAAEGEGAEDEEGEEQGCHYYALQAGTVWRVGVRSPAAGSSSSHSSPLPLLALVAVAALNLCSPQHGSPLTAARVLCKKLKPLVLQVASPVNPTVLACQTAAAAAAMGEGSGGSSNTSGGMAVDGSDDDNDAGSGAGAGAGKGRGRGRQAAAGGGVSRAASGRSKGAASAADRDASAAAAEASALLRIRLEPRVVRARAAYFVLALIADSAVEAGAAGSATAPLPLAVPPHVLARLPAVAALLQHLCVAASGIKAEGRAHAGEVVCALRALLPHSLRRAFVRFLLRLSRASKAPYRLFAVEAAQAMLCPPEGAQAQGGGEGEEEREGEASRLGLGHSIARLLGALPLPTVPAAFLATPAAPTAAAAAEASAAGAAGPAAAAEGGVFPQPDFAASLSGRGFSAAAGAGVPAPPSPYAPLVGLRSRGAPAQALAAAAACLPCPLPLRLALAEGPLPTPAEAAQEAGGYDEEAWGYAGEEGEAQAGGNAAPSLQQGAGAGAGAVPERSRSRGVRVRRASICALGMGVGEEEGEGSGGSSALTPARLQMAGLGSGSAPPSRALSSTSTARKSSPFYGPAAAAAGAAASAARRGKDKGKGGKGGKGVAGRRDSLASTLSAGDAASLFGDEEEEGAEGWDEEADEEESGGCADPRPTLLILASVLLHRASDKAPAVRARALAAVTDLLQAPRAAPAGGAPSLGSHTLHAAVLTHLAACDMATQQQQQRAAAGPGGGAAGGRCGDVTLGDVSAFGAGAGASPGAASVASAGLAGVGEGVSVRALTCASPLIPLLVRRLEEPKPAVKRAALAALAALAAAPGAGCGVIVSGALLRHARAQAAAGGEALSYSQQVRAHVAVLCQAVALAQRARLGAAPAWAGDAEPAGAAGSPPSAVLGLYALELLAAKATDPSVLVRKTALTALDEVLAAEPHTPAVQRLWLASLLPSVMDPEASVAALALQAVAGRLINAVATAPLPAAAASPDSLAPPAEGSHVWSMLALAADNGDLAHCLSVAVSYMARYILASAGATGSGSGAAAAPTKAAAAAAGASAGVGSLPCGFAVPGIVGALVAAVSPQGQRPAPLSGASLAGAWGLLELLTRHLLDARHPACAMLLAQAAKAAASGDASVAAPRRAASASASASSAAAAGGAPRLPAIAASVAAAVPAVAACWGRMLGPALARLAAAAASASGLGRSGASTVSEGSAASVSMVLAGAGLNDSLAASLLNASSAAGGEGASSGATAAEGGASAAGSLSASGVFSEGNPASPGGSVADDSVMMTGPGGSGEAEGPLLSACAASCLQVLAACGPVVPAAAAASLLSSLAGGLACFCWDSAVVTAAVKACAAMCLRACATQSAVPAAQERWARPLLASAQALLTRYLASPSSSALRAGGEAVAVVLHCVGELALLALAASSGQGVADAAPAAEAAAGEAGLLRPAPVSVPPHLVTCLQALLSRHITVSAPLHGSAAAAPALPSSSSASATLPLPDAVRAHAVLCLGKLCLRDGGLAKRYVAVFVRDLQAGGAAVAAPPAVRNNCLLVLGDLCVRYTSVVDRHLPALAGCLADPHPLLRRHGVQLLGRLLASEYVKLRAPLFYRLAAALADGDEGVRRLAQAALSGVLAPRARGALSAHFVSLAVVLTGCSALPGFAHIAASAAADADEGEEGAASSSSSSASSAASAAPSPASFVLASFLRRQHVYRSLLAALPDEAKLALHGKLASEVLAAPAEGVVTLAPGGGRAAATLAGAAGPSAFPLGSAELLIADALAIMACPEMRAVTAAGASKSGAAAGAGAGSDKSAGGAGGAASDDADEEAAAAAAEAAEGGEGGSAAARLAAAAASAKCRLLARLVSKHIAENVLPVVLGLRQTCAAARSPLSAQVAAYVDVLMTDHGAEIRDALVSDRRTLAELEFDHRQAQQQKPQAQAASARAGADVQHTAIAAAAASPMPPRAAGSAVAAAAGVRRTVSAPAAAATPRTPGPAAPAAAAGAAGGAGMASAASATPAGGFGALISPKLKRHASAAAGAPSAAVAATTAPTSTAGVAASGAAAGAGVASRARSGSAGVAPSAAAPEARATLIQMRSPEEPDGEGSAAARASRRPSTWKVAVPPSPYKGALLAEEDSEDSSGAGSESDRSTAGSTSRRRRGGAGGKPPRQSGRGKAGRVEGLGAAPAAAVNTGAAARKRTAGKRGAADRSATNSMAEAEM